MRITRQQKLQRFANESTDIATVCTHCDVGVLCVIGVVLLALRIHMLFFLFLVPVIYISTLFRVRGKYRTGGLSTAIARLGHVVSGCGVTTRILVVWRAGWCVGCGNVLTHVRFVHRSPDDQRGCRKYLGVM